MVPRQNPNVSERASGNDSDGVAYVLHAGQCTTTFSAVEYRSPRHKPSISSEVVDQPCTASECGQAHDSVVLGQKHAKSLSFAVTSGRSENNRVRQSSFRSQTNCHTHKTTMHFHEDCAVPRAQFRVIHSSVVCGLRRLRSFSHQCPLLECSARQSQCREQNLDV